MRKSLALFTLALVAVGGASQAQGAKAQAKPAAQAPAQPKAAAAPAPTSGAKPEALQDRASYIIGLNLGKSLKAQEVPCTTDVLMQGLRDGLSGNPPALSESEIQTAMQAFQQQLASKQEEKNKVVGDKTKQEGDAFLATTKSKAGVKTTASGLQYEVLKEGTGAAPKPTDEVTVNYEGTLLDGTIFDSSYKRNEPATFPVNGVIPGWTEALQLMKPGSKYKLYIPASLAYGDKGAGGAIGPNATLVFQVELLSVNAAGNKVPAADAESLNPPPTTEQKPPADAKPPVR
jgi:FKBP-type peptidyl-prolyl cis-trans isomerase FklB